jgi:hypothetical protein
MGSPRFRVTPGHRQRLVAIGLVLVVASGCLAVNVMTSSAATGSPKAQVRVAWTRLRAAFVRRNARAVCAMLTRRGRGDFVAVIEGVRSTRSCESAAVDVFQLHGRLVSKVAHARLRSVVVAHGTATTIDTSSRYREHWVLTGNQSWKVSELPSGDV